MKIIAAKDYAEMSRRAAALIAAQVTLKPNSVLGLATGSGPIGTYQQLIEWHTTEYLDFSQISTVNLDEYYGLEKTSPQSYAHFMREQLFEHINIKLENTHIPDGTNLDQQAECARYSQLIRSLGRVDLQLLGIGHNGHIAFNEPGESFEPEVHCVGLAQQTIEANQRFFDSIDQVPKKAYTMGIGNILKARKILMLVSGEDKADALCQMVTGPVTPRLPASVLQLHGDVTVVADREALALLERQAPHLITSHN